MRRGDSRVVEPPPASRSVFIGKLFEHDLLVGGHSDVVLGGNHIGAGERGAKVRRMQVAADGPVALDRHHSVDVGLAVDDLTGGGHLGGQRVAGVGVCGGVAGGLVDTVKLSTAPIRATIAA